MKYDTERIIELENELAKLKNEPLEVRMRKWMEENDPYYEPDFSGDSRNWTFVYLHEFDDLDISCHKLV